MAALCTILGLAAIFLGVYAWLAATDADLARQHSRRLEAEIDRYRQASDATFEEWRGDDGSQPDDQWWREGKHPFGDAG